MKKFFPIYVRIPLIFGIFFFAIEYVLDTGSQPAFIKYPVVALILVLFFFLQIAIELIFGATYAILDALLTEEQRKEKERQANLPFAETEFYQKWIKKLTRSGKIDDEDTLLLDHDYDGIKELDNVLPPWWVNLFIACVIFAAIYLFRFEIMGDDNQIVEFDKEMAEAKLAVEEYQKTAPDQMNKEKVTLLTDAKDLATGKEIFTTNCVACHRADLGGAIGPNLTDDKWILGGGIKNVFNTLTEGGRPGKGMVSWKDILKPTQMQQVASYVLSMHDTNPKDPKPAEGDVWVDENAPKKETASKPKDSTSVALN